MKTNYLLMNLFLSSFKKNKIEMKKYSNRSHMYRDAQKT